MDRRISSSLLDSMSIHLKGEKLTEKDVPHLVDEFKKLALTDPVLRAMGQVDFGAVAYVLKKWITVEYSGEGISGRAIMGKRDQRRRFNSVLEMARIIMGEVAAVRVRKHEKELARMAYSSWFVSTGLNSAIGKLYQKLQEHSNWKAIREELGQISSGTKAQGAYESYLKLTGRLEVLAEPRKFDIKRKIIAFHDMTEYLQPATKHVTATEGSGTVSNPRPSSRDHSKLEIDTQLGAYTGPVTQFRDKSRGKIDLWNPNSNNDGVVSCLVSGIPVWAGTSMTTARMLETAEWAGCDKNEKTAIAWAIFAYWRLDYDKAVSPFHTFHEVFDVAKNYGVKYDPFFVPPVPPEYIPAKL